MKNLSSSPTKYKAEYATDAANKMQNVYSFHEIKKKWKQISCVPKQRKHIFCLNFTIPLESGFELMHTDVYTKSFH